MKLVSSMSIASSLLVHAAMAQTVAPVATLPTVVVNGDQTEASATKVDEARILSYRAATSDTASLLREVPGVSLYGAGGISSLPAIHGLADDRVRIKVDGMDLIASCPNHMNPALSYVDPSNVLQLQVFAGITPVSMGGDAIGGTIAVDTAMPVFAAPGQPNVVQGQWGAFYRSNGHAVGTHLAATFANETLNLSYAGSTAKAKNYQAGKDFKNFTFTGRSNRTLPLDEVGSTAYKTQNHTLGLAIKRDKHLMEAKLGYQDVPYQFYPNQRMDMLGNTQKRINLRYEGQFDWGKLEARAYQETVDHFMDFGADKRYWYGSGSGGPTALNGTDCSSGGLGMACAAGMPMYTKSKTTGAIVKADVAWSNEDLLRLGAEFQQYRLNDWWTASGAMMWPNTFWNIRQGERDRSGLFAEWEKTISTSWQTLAGLRFENVTTNAAPVHGYNQATFPTATSGTTSNSQVTDAAMLNTASRARSDNNWDMTAMSKHTVNPMYSVDLGLTYKTRSPNLYERYSWSSWQMAALMNNFVGDGNGYFGNANLKPEKASKLTATFDWHATDHTWEIKATPHFTHVEDFIDAMQWSGNAETGAARGTLLTNQFSVLRYTNQSARLYGLDIAGKLPLGKMAMGEIGLNGLISYTHGKNRSTGDSLYNIMPMNARLTLTHQSAKWDSAVELVIVKAKTHVSAMRNEIKTPGYGLINLRTSHTWKNVRLDVGMDNVFDKHYFLPLGGAYTGQGTTMTNPALPNYPQWGTAVPGQGRSIYTGLTVTF